MSSAFAKHPLALFLGLVFFVEWAAALALFPISPVGVGVIALVPTPVALLTAALVEGREGVGQLWRHSWQWHARARWYALALLIPTAIHLLAAWVAFLFGAQLNLRPAALLALLPLTMVLAVGEEIGWQGYALPRLRAAFPSLSTAVIFGAVHATFHLPMYLLPLPPELRQASPFGLFLLMAIGFALFRVWLSDHTAGNVPVIVIYHAAINTSVLLLDGVDGQLLGWLLPVVWILAAQILLVTRDLNEQPWAGGPITERTRQFWR